MYLGQTLAVLFILRQGSCSLWESFYFSNDALKKNFKQQLYWPIIHIPDTSPIETIHFKVFSGFTVLHPLSQFSLEHFYPFKKENLYLPFSSPPPLLRHTLTPLHHLAKTNLFKSIDFPILDFRVDGTMQCVFFCDWFLSPNELWIKVHSYDSAYLTFISFNGKKLICNSIDVNLFVHLLTGGHLGCFYFGAAVISLYKFLCEHLLSFLLGLYLYLWLLAVGGAASLFSKSVVPF